MHWAGEERKKKEKRVKKIFPSVTGSILNNSQQKTLTVPAVTGQHVCYISPHPTPP